MVTLFYLHPKSSGGTRRSRTEGIALRTNSAQSVLELQELRIIVARGKAVLDEDRRLNMKLIAEEVGLLKTDVHRIITEDLHMRKICAKLVPKNLSDVWEFLAQNNITTLPHPSYSPDLTPCDFFLFPKLKTHIKEYHFGTVENVQTAATRTLNISSEDFLHRYEEWQQCWNRCIRSQGDYFEEDKL